LIPGSSAILFGYSVVLLQVQHKNTRAVKRLITINRIQNKRLCLIIYVGALCIIILFIYKYTHMLV